MVICKNVIRLSRLYFLLFMYEHGVLANILGGEDMRVLFRSIFV